MHKSHFMMIRKNVACGMCECQGCIRRQHH